MNSPDGKHRVWKWTLRGIGLLLATSLLGFAGFAWGVYSDSKPSRTTTADAAIVLGGAIRGDQPSAGFRERINHGIELLRAGKVRRLILTGAPPDGEPYAESFVARKYAIEKDVPDECILTEAQSHTTYQNLYYARELAQENDLQTFILVSDPFHLRRVMRIAVELNLSAQASPTPTSRTNDIEFFVRETGRNMKFVVWHTLNPHAASAELAIHEH